MSEPIERIAAGVTRDSRIDKAISWGLATCATVAFGVGGYTFTSLKTELGDSRKAMQLAQEEDRTRFQSIAVKLAVIEQRMHGGAAIAERVEKLADMLGALDKSLAAHSALPSHHSADSRLDELTRRAAAMEREIDALKREK